MIDVLNKYHADGLLVRQFHHTLPLVIWNYSKNAEWNKVWDDVTMMCRGLVTDKQGNIVARPFRKFFNEGEGRYTPTDSFTIYDKLDGSLGILFWYDGEWIICTRGSFVSDQAFKAEEMLGKYDLSKLDKNFTYKFEIIFRENTIVCRYDEEMLGLLGMINTATGEDIFMTKELCAQFRQDGFDVVTIYDGLDWRQIKDLNWENKEGFVVRFSNGDRCKIKFEDYLRLHRIMTNCTTRSIWDLLSSGQDLTAIIENVPDEFMEDVKNYETKLRSEFEDLKKSAVEKFQALNTPEISRRDFAVKNLAENGKLAAALFRMKDGQEFDSVIWKIIEPEYAKI